MLKVTAAIMENDMGQVFIAKRTDEGEFWEFPGGKVNPGETHEECLAREMEEEFGIIIQVGHFFHGVVHKYPKLTIELLAYRAKWVKGEIKPVEHSDYRWVHPQELTNFSLAPADIPIAHKLQK